MDIIWLNKYGDGDDDDDDDDDDDIVQGFRLLSLPVPRLYLLFYFSSHFAVHCCSFSLSFFVKHTLLPLDFIMLFSFWWFLASLHQGFDREYMYTLPIFVINLWIY